MTATAPDLERLLELDADTRLAWSAYSDRLRELTGAEYERIESESWTELQNELQRLEREREELSAGAV
jgi:cell division septum initiation protein DivIVA